jgi:hypothetical protein
MDSYTDKKRDKGDKSEFNEVDAPTIRIILKSQETKNLDFVAYRIHA